MCSALIIVHAIMLMPINQFYAAIFNARVHNQQRLTELPKIMWHTVPRINILIPVMVFQSEAPGEEQHSGYSGSVSVYNGGSSSCGPHLQPCIASGPTVRIHSAGVKCARSAYFKMRPGNSNKIIQKEVLTSTLDVSKLVICSIGKKWLFGHNTGLKFAL